MIIKDPPPTFVMTHARKNLYDTYHMSVFVAFIYSTNNNHIFHLDQGPNTYPDKSLSHPPGDGDMHLGPIIQALSAAEKSHCGRYHQDKQEGKMTETEGWRPPRVDKVTVQ